MLWGVTFLAAGLFVVDFDLWLFGLVFGLTFVSLVVLIVLVGFCGCLLLIWCLALFGVVCTGSGSGLVIYDVCCFRAVFVGLGG